MTRGVMEQLSPLEILEALGRHQSLDWGEVPEADKEANNEAVHSEARIMSAYKSANGTKFWIITEWDRSLTTILLPSEY